MARYNGSVDPRVAEMRQFLERKAASREAEIALLHARACADFDAIVGMIIREAHPRRIVQWGSLLRPERFRPYSDIDVALEGVTDPALFSLILRRAEQLTRFPVDIVQLERIEPEFRISIQATGRVVYERP
jgi:predicted nucleotidyltransferase